MSLGVVIHLERDVEGVDTRELQGRALASHRHDLDIIADEVGQRGLAEFVSFSQAEADVLADDMKFDSPVKARSSGNWFDSGLGLGVVRAISQYLRDNEEELEDTEALLTELALLERILDAAHREKVRFRFGVDY